jgi:hypothetical protein
VRSACGTVSRSPTWAAVSLHGPSPGSFEASAARPPVASARRYRFVGILLTGTAGPLPVPGAPASIKSAADNRTCSQRARSAAVSPPPSGYLITPGIAPRGSHYQSCNPPASRSLDPAPARRDLGACGGDGRVGVRTAQLALPANRCADLPPGSGLGLLHRRGSCGTSTAGSPGSGDDTSTARWPRFGCGLSTRSKVLEEANFTPPTKELR